jgi:RNA polymerase-binding transcription factor DksA
MLLHTRPGLERLTRAEREFAHRVATVIRRRTAGAEPPDARPADLFDAALAATLEQHNEVVWTRLADRSRVLLEAMARAHEGKYGICVACGCRIPRRRLQAMPTATLCVSCQAKRESVCRDS